MRRFISQKHNYYAVSFNRHGRVSRIHDSDTGYDDCHIIEVLREDTPKEILAYYRNIGVSYISEDKDDIDLNVVLNKIYSIFGTKKLLFEGGSIIGAFERENLIDELSFVVVPIIAGENSKPLFYKSIMQEFFLLDVKTQSDGSV